MYKSKQDFYRIGRVRISITNNKEVIEMIKDIVSAQIKGYVCISNMRTVVIANSDDSYQKVMENSLFNTPDGTPLVWCGKLWGLKKVQRACGPHIFEEMLKDKDSGLKHFFLGDTEDTLAKLTDKCKNNFKTEVVGAYSPPFKPLEEYNIEEIAKMINDSGANVVWTSLRAPKQDFLGAMLTPYLNEGIVVIGVGAAFRYILGEYREPKGFMQKIGLAGILFKRANTSTLERIKWYFKHSFYLAKFSVSILAKRLSGRPYWE